ncbi:MAG: RecX family transcriptional regulator [Spirochaetaceae bacterium]
MHVENSNSQNVNTITITSCQRGTSQGSYRILLEDGSSFFISVDFFIANKLAKGLEVDSHLLSLMKSESLFVEAYIKGLSLLTRQLYSTFNLKRKLHSKELDPEGIRKAIDYLEDQGYLNDHKYATNWVLSRLSGKLDSYTGLLSALMKKGISSVIAKDILSDLYTDEIEEKIIINSINKLKRKNKTQDFILGSLYRKGFNRRKIEFYLIK